jgi:predicted metal-dependent hydrolase
MNQNKTIYIEGIGLVLLQSSRRAKRIVITVRPVQGIRVAVPLDSSFDKAQHFAISKKYWLAEQITRINSRMHLQSARLEINRPAAIEMLHKRLDYLAQKHRFSYSRVIFRNQKTRWGSCSSKNVISLNIQLAALPEELADYVIIHELVHTKIKNHSPAFWAEMERLVGNTRQMRSRLKQHDLAR